MKYCFTKDGVRAVLDNGQPLITDVKPETGDIYHVVIRREPESVRRIKVVMTSEEPETVRYRMMESDVPGRYVLCRD